MIVDTDIKKLFSGIAWIVAFFLSLVICSVAGIAYYIHQHGLKSVLSAVWNGVGG